jgi:spore coat protein A, manganese oxidase
VSVTRRRFLHQTGLATAGLMWAQSAPHHPAKNVKPSFDTNSLAKFVDPLPIPLIARSTERRPDPTNSKLKIPYYRLALQKCESNVHRDMKPTRFWGVAGSSPGPTFETRSGEGILVEWANELPASHFLPIDHSLHGAESDKPDVRAVIHLHGAKTPPHSDGYPEDWYVPGKSAIYHYPNQQDATLLWYHDHAMGINRLNMFAGLFGFFIVRDSVEDSLNLPQGKYEIPLVIFDRQFDLESQLYYPVSTYPDKPWVPEFFGDATLINGKLFPYLEVEPRKYRFRVLNAANGRFFHLSLSTAGNIHQIGTDQGLLPAPVPLKQLSMAPGERADVIVDFSEHAGEEILLKNDVFQPVMQFRVSKAKVTDTSSLPPTLRPVPKIAEAEAVKTRTLALTEIDDMVQNPVIMLLNNTHWNMPVTENPKLDSVEIWNLVNPTDDSHPIHIHLVRFQILDRRRIDSFAFQNENILRYRGGTALPEAFEAGWKDTVRADPGMVTRIIVRFEGYTGRYVWHCHILEHGDNEMMRPYDVIA